MKKVTTLLAVIVAAAVALVTVERAEHGTPQLPATQHPAPADAAPVFAQIAPQGAGGSTLANAGRTAGLRVREDRRCRVDLQDVVTSTGEMFSAYRCMAETPRAPHPYAHYDNGSLEVLAWSDPEAAALLGQRLAGADWSQASAMLMRATALDGDTRRLSWLADQAYATVRVDGDLQLDNVMRRYELAALASRLDGDPATALFLRKLLVDAGLEDSRLDALDDRVATMLESIRDIQRAVLGEVRYGGQTDA